MLSKLMSKKDVMRNNFYSEAPLAVFCSPGISHQLPT